jgi:hypothetical protein
MRWGWNAYFLMKDSVGRAHVHTGMDDFFWPCPERRDEGYIRHTVVSNDGFEEREKGG